MVETLIKKLRGNVGRLTEGNCREAADRLEALEREKEELRHKAEKYDSVVKALSVCDGGRYRNDTIESCILALERRDTAERQLAERDADLARLQEIVRTYGDRFRMANAPAHLQQTIDAAFSTSRAELAGSGDGWRDMADAPKDGEPVLLEYQADDDKLYYCVSRWVDTHWRGYPATAFTRWSRPFPASPSTAGEW